MEYLLSDSHYHHKMLVETGKRPDGYELLIKESWLSQVQPDDVVYHLGDVCMGDKVKVHEEYIMPMPGYKILIRGNHDKEKDSWYLSHGWDEIHDQLRLKRPWRVLLTHKPQPDDGSFDLNIFGHLHNNTHRLTPELKAMLTPKHRLLALECVQYKLIPFIDFIEGKIEQPGLPVLTG